MLFTRTFFYFIIFKLFPFCDLSEHLPTGNDFLLRIKVNFGDDKHHSFEVHCSSQLENWQVVPREGQTSVSSAALWDGIPDETPLPAFQNPQKPTQHRVNWHPGVPSQERGDTPGVIGEDASGKHHTGVAGRPPLSEHAASALTQDVHCVRDSRANTSLPLLWIDKWPRIAKVLKRCNFSESEKHQNEQIRGQTEISLMYDQSEPIPRKCKLQIHLQWLWIDYTPVVGDWRFLAPTPHSANGNAPTLRGTPLVCKDLVDQFSSSGASFVFSLCSCASHLWSGTRRLKMHLADLFSRKIEFGNQKPILLQKSSFLFLKSLGKMNIRLKNSLVMWYLLRHHACMIRVCNSLYTCARDLFRTKALLDICFQCEYIVRPVAPQLQKWLDFCGSAQIPVFAWEHQNISRKLDASCEEEENNCLTENKSDTTQSSWRTIGISHDCVELEDKWDEDSGCACVKVNERNYFFASQLTGYGCSGVKSLSQPRRFKIKQCLLAPSLTPWQTFWKRFSKKTQQQKQQTSWQVQGLENCSHGQLLSAKQICLH